MARAPFQVLVFPYRLSSKGVWQFAVFSRADKDCWQGISGGGEDTETPIQTARWKIAADAGLELDSPFLPLDTLNSIPVSSDQDSTRWGEEIYVIREYCFGVDASKQEIHLSKEFKGVRWLPYAEAAALLTFEGSRTALWELNDRLLRRIEHFTTGQR